MCVDAAVCDRGRVAGVSPAASDGNERFGLVIRQTNHFESLRFVLQLLCTIRFLVDMIGLSAFADAAIM
jgi:hypothetical protein